LIISIKGDYLKKPLNNITFIIISTIFLILYSYSIYENHKYIEYQKKQKIISINNENNKTGYFNSLYIKTKNIFK